MAGLVRSAYCRYETLELEAWHPLHDLYLRINTLVGSNAVVYVGAQLGRRGVGEVKCAARGKMRGPSGNQPRAGLPPQISPPHRLTPPSSYLLTSPKYCFSRTYVFLHISNNLLISKFRRLH